MSFCVPERVDDFVKRGKANLFFVDCGFHVEDGIKLMQTLKKAKPSTPVIFITGVASEEIVLKAFRNGARDFFVKPINVDDFRQTVRGLLSIKRTVRERREAFISGHLSERTDGRKKRERKQADLSFVIDYIQKNFSDELTLEAIAEQMNLSKYHLCRSFKKRMGMSPKKFLTYIRMNTAKELMSKDLNISAIAAEIGYNDISSFIEQFKKHTGMTPSAYRKTLE